MPLAYQEHYTFDDYQHWEGHWELIEGMPYAMTPSPSVTHQIVAFNVATSIKNALKNQKTNCSDRCTILLETDWQIANDTVVRPDVMVICQDIDEKVLVTPDLIIEVVSSTSVKAYPTISLFIRMIAWLKSIVMMHKDLSKKGIIQIKKLNSQFTTAVSILILLRSGDEKAIHHFARSKALASLREGYSTRPERFDLLLATAETLRIDMGFCGRRH
ncbi:MAG: Uma2 family endonuclease [Gammaproteobacteria bacterium]|nr:Uma2 family endonuclease [Gammaproteobacteria bacterium]